MSIFTPQLQSKGQFRLSAPLENLLSSSTLYTCTSLRTIQDVASSGVDVFETYYAPLQLTEEQFAADLASNAYLVTLVAGVGEPIVVPSTYFVEMPRNDGVKYIGAMIAIDLAILPMDFDLNPLKQRLLEVTMETIGVVGVAKVIVTTNPINKSQDEHTAIEATRNSNITHTTTDYGLMLAERARADALQAKNVLLEQYIKDHLAPTP